MPDRIIAAIQRNTREVVHVALRAKHGSIGLELKVAARNARGELVETPRGVRMPVSRLRDAIRALHAAEREAVRLGLIPPASG